MRYGGFLHVTTFWHNFVVPDISRNFSGFHIDWHNNTTFFNLMYARKNIEIASIYAYRAYK